MTTPTFDEWMDILTRITTGNATAADIATYRAIRFASYGATTTPAVLRAISATSAPTDG
jgi:hypothetical protein